MFGSGGRECRSRQPVVQPLHQLSAEARGAAQALLEGGDGREPGAVLPLDRKSVV